MKQSKNVLCWSVLVAIIAGFMAGCGGGGFKSKTYSEKEIAAYLKNLKPQESLNEVTGAPEMAEIPEQTAIPEQGAIDTQMTNTNLPAAETGPVGTTPEAVDTAASKVMSEPPQEAVDWIATNNTQMMEKSPGVAKFIRGVTVDIAAGNGGSALQVSVHAIVVLGGGDEAPLLLSALNAPLTYVEGTVPTINVTLQHDESNPDLVQPLDNVILAAACTDAACADVQVRMQFKDTDIFQTAVFRLGLQDGKYVMIENNLTDTPAFKTYEVARQELRDIAVQAAALATTETAPEATPADSGGAAPIADLSAASTEQPSDMSLSNMNAAAPTSVDAALTNGNASVVLPVAPAVSAAAAAALGAVGAPVGPRVAATGDIAGLMAKIRADEVTAAAAKPAAAAPRAAATGDVAGLMAAAAKPAAAAPRAAATGDVAGLMAAAAKPAAAAPRAAATGDVAGLMANIRANEAATVAAKAAAPAAAAAPTTSAGIMNKIRTDRLARQRASNAQ